ncbi:MAG TPA: glycosyltransferase family 1 protein [Vicinamibacterales bacterium]|nr:glycosyltransferase family 1 protein [Vicinamibacterales bacterium]
MRIAIDARKLRDFGIGTYIRNILMELSRLDRDTEYVVLCRPDDVDSGDVLGRNFRMVPEAAPAYSIAEQFRIPLALAREGVQLVHAPHYVLPPLLRCRSVVTIHDCIHLMFPEYLPNRLAHVYARGSMWSASRKADRILTVSEASKRDILRFFNVAPDRVEVIYNAIDERFLAPADAERMDLVRQRYQLDHPFVLYVGNIKPHKNIERLIDAFGRARSEVDNDLKLIIIGDEISKYPALRQSVHKHKLDKHVRFLGFQPMETLAAFYRLARVFVFPSLYEGFGLPPLEAMACGAPVVTSNVSSLPEVAGGAALLVDPYDEDAIANAMIRAITDDYLRAELIEKGRQRAQSFSWTQSVRKIHNIYMQVARG